jgi:hypothetical protein
MDELLQQLKIDDSRLKRIIVNAISHNLSSLSEPCVYPEVKKHYYEMVRLSGLTEKEIKAFTKRRWAGRKEAKFMAHMDPIANFYVFLMQHYIKKRDKIGYRNLMIFYIIRHYANLMHKYFPYCIDDAFKYALETLTRTHLFSREKTIPNALFFLSDEMIRRWTSGLEKNDLDEVSKFMQESRNRLEQSMRSFASTYHKAAKEGVGLKTEVIPTDDEDNENAFQNVSQETGTRLIDKVVQKITVYKHVDHNAMMESRKEARISSALATQIVNKLNNTKYVDKLRTIYRLYVKDLQNSDSLCGKQFYPFVRKLMSIKRTRMKIYFKQQINILLLDILKEIGYNKKYNELTSQTQFLHNLFLAYYLTMVFKNTVC